MKNGHSTSILWQESQGEGDKGVEVAITQERYVSPNVVASYLEIEKRQVLALTRKGKLPAHPVDPNAARKVWRYKLSEIDAAMAANTATRGLSRVSPQINNVLGSPRSQRG